MPYSDVEKRRARSRERYALQKRGDWTPQPATRKAEDLICDHCGQSFYRSPANRARRGSHSYCSRACMAAAFVGRTEDQHPRWKGSETRPCENCGKDVTRPQWAWNKRDLTFCDRSCFGQWKAKNWTGQDNPCWRGGHPPYYGANWLRQQRDARRRDGHQCQLCGIPESECRRALNVHHIVPFRLFGVERSREANALSNLISLCDRCHMYAERPSQSGVIKDWATLRPLALALLQADQT